jgi:hypothetical protein
MNLNTGQCLPVSIIAQECIETVRRQGLDPTRTALWMIPSRLSCNFGLFAGYIKTLLEKNGLQELVVYAGQLSNVDLSPAAALDTYLAYLLGGVLRRMVCRVRPYEAEPGRTDRLFERARERLLEAFAGRASRLEAARWMARSFAAVRTRPEARPKVAVFGDLYVRDNDVMNQDLIRAIEKAGGEAVTTPYTEYVQIIARAYFRRWLDEGTLGPVIRNASLLGILKAIGSIYTRDFVPVVGPVDADRAGDLEARLAKFATRIEHDGESLDNILKILHIVDRHPDIALFVQAGPAFCCPALVTEAMGGEIERVTGVPVVTLTYDGTGAPQNDVLVPYLAYARAEMERSRVRAGLETSSPRFRQSALR